MTWLKSLVLFVLMAASAAGWCADGKWHSHALTVGTLWVPDGIQVEQSRFDLTLHLHGDHEVVQRNFQAAQCSGVLVTATLPGLSSIYREQFKDPEVFFGLLLETRQQMQNHLDLEALPDLRSVTVSSFSAGFGAVRELLKHEAIFDRIDAILMADSIYAGFVDAASRRIDPELMAGFARYARSAARGERRFLITHSHLHTPDYASTVETADYLIASVGGIRSGMDENWEGFRLASISRLGRFEVLGFAGATGENHLAHLREISWFYRRLSALGH